jgi:hypothetical protein
MMDDGTRREDWNAGMLEDWGKTGIMRHSRPYGRRLEDRNDGIKRFID